MMPLAWQKGFSVLSVSRMYGNHWLVIRHTDSLLVFSHEDLSEAIKWLKQFSDTKALTRKGKKLSGRAVEALGLPERKM